MRRIAIEADRKPPGAYVGTMPGVTADTAVRLARYFGGTAQFWLNLQSIYDLRKAERSAETKRTVRQIEPLERAS